MTDTVHIWICDGCSIALSDRSGVVAVLGTNFFLCTSCWNLQQILDMWAAS